MEFGRASIFHLGALERALRIAQRAKGYQGDHQPTALSRHASHAHANEQQDLTRPA
jgi:hypothetical protein